jgi:biotin carboxylase
MTELPSDLERIASTAEGVAIELCLLFSHTEQDARRLFHEYHARRSGETRGWSCADYYDHEGPLALALEIEYERLTGKQANAGGMAFLNWRQEFQERFRKEGYFVGGKKQAEIERLLAKKRNL